MGCVGWILVGLVAGGIAKLLLPGKDVGGCVVTVLVGIAGASLGGFVGTLLGFGSFRGFDVRSLLLAVGGAVVVLLVLRLFFDPSKKGSKSKKQPERRLSPPIMRSSTFSGLDVPPQS